MNVLEVINELTNLETIGQFFSTYWPVIVAFLTPILGLLATVIKLIGSIRKARKDGVLKDNATGRSFREINESNEEIRKETNKLKSLLNTLLENQEKQNKANKYFMLQTNISPDSKLYIEKTLEGITVPKIEEETKEIVEETKEIVVEKGNEIEQLLKERKEARKRV